MMKQQFLILFLVVSAPMLAQPKDWTLDACMRYAIEHNPARGKQLSQNEIYRIDRQESAARFLPTLSLGVNATLGVERTLVKDGADYAYVDVNGIKALATMPSKEELIAKMLGSMQAPIANFAGVLSAMLRGVVVALNAIAEKKNA